MSKYRIVQVREMCIGCGACANICPENWEMADYGKSKPKKTDIDELDRNKEAADACPVGCIRIKEE
jgi:ferredoxin